MDHSSDPFAAENNGTARFVGGVATTDISVLDNGVGVDVGVGSAGTAGSAAVSGGACANAIATTTTNAANEFQTMKPSNGQQLPLTGGRTTTDIPHSELVKMLYYLEGELQARDVVIAALRNERVKNYITQLRTKRIQPNDPYAAIFRDKVAIGGNLISRESSTQAAQAEMEVRQIIEQQMEQQYQMVSKQRATHLRMVSILTESLENNQRMLQELEEEKRKHEHDTAQGDDITYGLELERTKLRQELEEERAQLKKMEKDMKKLQETLDYERNRQKQIVLLLIAERKKILMKYIEEGKRSEDLAQILAEEKQRSDTIAEGLEEESKKSLRMEEDLEKQAAAFENERKTLKASLVKEEHRVKELEQEIALLRSENEALKKHQQNSVVVGAATAVAAAKTRAFNHNEEACATPMINIAKIVQPTATVSSVPVSGPTTGIARSIAPGQNIRSGIASAPTISPALTAANSAAAAATASSVATTAPTTNQIVGLNDISAALQTSTSTSSSTAITSAQSSASSSSLSSTTTITATATATATASPLAPTVAASPSPSPAKMQPTATIQRAPGGKYSAIAAASLDGGAPSPHPVPIAVPPVTVPPASARGAPPPIPPNKPIIPPKREPSLSRIGSISNATVAAVVGASGTAVATTVGAAAAANAKLN